MSDGIPVAIPGFDLMLNRFASRALALALASAAILGGGCGGGPPPSGEADPARAREALSASLDAWKRGETPASLATRTPPIRVADEDWLAGRRLDDFRVQGEPRAVGSTLNCRVSLSLKDAKGRPSKKDVVYLVGTDPALTVIRQEGP